MARLFGRKRKDESPSSSNAPSNAQRHTQSDSRASNSSHPPAPDSAYASSEGQSTAESKNDVVSFENHGQLKGVSSDRNLELNKNTGDVTDKDTGEVVTTVTTTTTTTTITRRGGNKDTIVEVSTQPGESISRSHSQTRSRTPNIAEAPGDNTHSADPNHLAPDTVVHTRSNPSPAPTPIQTQQQHPSSLQPGRQTNSEHPAYRTPVSPQSNTQSPFAIPARNPNRKSWGTEEPPSPGRLNFSRPGRSVENLRPQVSQEPMPEHRPVSTFENIKAAAVGLHGVGETLRATLNDTVDSRLPMTRNPEKLAALNAKNHEELERGRREMARLSERTEPRSSVAPSSIAPSTWSQEVAEADRRFGYGEQQAAPMSRAEPDYGIRDPRLSQQGTGTQMRQVPSSFSPESQGLGGRDGAAGAEKTGGLRKLLKRKDVGKA